MSITLILVVHAALTLYMMVILLYWVAPWLQLELTDSRWRWVARLAEPLVTVIRKRMPYMGPSDLGPLAALVLVWIVRTLAVPILANVTGVTAGPTPL